MCVGVCVCVCVWVLYVVCVCVQNRQPTAFGNTSRPLILSREVSFTRTQSVGNPAVKFSDLSEQTQRVPDDSSTPVACHANLNIQWGLQSQGKVHGHSMGCYSEDRIILCGSMAKGFRVTGAV